MPTNLGNSSVAKRLEKVSFHSNPKEGQCQRMFKLPHNCSHFTFQQSSSQNSPSQAPTVPKPELDVQLHLEKAEEPETKLPTSTGSSKKQENSRRTSTFASLTVLKPLTVWITKKLWKLTSRDEITRTPYCFLRNLFAGQEATVRTGLGTMNCFQIGKGVHQGCILSPCLFNLYAEFIT